MPSGTGRPPRRNGRARKQYEQILDGYNTPGTYTKAFDEMFDGQGNVRGIDPPDTALDVWSLTDLWHSAAGAKEVTPSSTRSQLRAKTPAAQEK